jgi:hypothetical protein
MTDHNFINLPTLDLLGMLYSVQANYANAQSDREREIVQKQKDEILASMRTIVDVLNQQIEQFS